MQNSFSLVEYSVPLNHANQKILLFHFITAAC